MRRFALPLVLVSGLAPLALTGCHAGYSPNTYAANAAQVEATVQRGVIIGVRQVLISATGTVGAVTGGAAGGVAGAQISGSPVTTALGAIGGTLVGGIGGTAAEQAMSDSKGWEYIIDEEPGDKLVSITQTSKTALPIGMNVLVIAGSQQARIVPDYTVQLPVAKPAEPKTPVPPGAGAATEINISPLLPDDDTNVPLQMTPIGGPAGPAAAVPAATGPATTAPATTAPATPAPTTTAPTTAPVTAPTGAPAANAAPVPAATLPASPSPAATP